MKTTRRPRPETLSETLNKPCQQLRNAGWSWPGSSEFHHTRPTARHRGEGKAQHTRHHGLWGEPPPVELQVLRGRHEMDCSGRKKGGLSATRQRRSQQRRFQRRQQRQPAQHDVGRAEEPRGWPAVGVTLPGHGSACASERRRLAAASRRVQDLPVVCTTLRLAPPQLTLRNSRRHPRLTHPPQPTPLLLARCRQ